MKSRTILVFLSLALMSACNAKLMDLTQTDVERGNTNYKGVTLESLNEGKNLYQQNCSECHNLKRPSSETIEKWNKLVPAMVKKLNAKMEKEVIDGRKQDLLLQYLVTASTAPKK